MPPERSHRAEQVNKPLPQVQAAHEADTERALRGRLDRRWTKTVEIDGLPADVYFFCGYAEARHGSLSPLGVHPRVIRQGVFFFHPIHHRRGWMTVKPHAAPSLRFPFTNLLEIADMAIGIVGHGKYMFLVRPAEGLETDLCQRVAAGGARPFYLLRGPFAQFAVVL